MSTILATKHLPAQLKAASSTPAYQAVRSIAAIHIIYEIVHITDSDTRPQLFPYYFHSLDDATKHLISLPKSKKQLTIVKRIPTNSMKSIQADYLNKDRSTETRISAAVAPYTTERE